MSATTSTTTAGPTKPQSSPHARQGSQGPRMSNGNAGGPRKVQNGAQKTDAGRKSPQLNGNGQQAKAKQHTKSKSSASLSDYLRSHGGTVEDANAVAQIRADLGGYYSEELVFNTFVSNGRNVEATRAALTQSKATSWASKVSPTVASPSAAAPVPAPAHIAQQQQAPRPRKVNKPAAAKATVAVEAAAPAPETIVDPEQMEKSLESALQATQTQAQELLNLQTQVSQVRTAQTELTGEKDALLKKIAEHEAEIAKDRARIQAIDSTLAQHKSSLADLQKTISQKTAKQ